MNILCTADFFLLKFLYLEYCLHIYVERKKKGINVERKSRLLSLT